MAESDWTQMGSPALDTTDMPRGVSAAFTVPNGGGSFVFGFRSASSSQGFGGYLLNISSFNPLDDKKGGSIRMAMKRYSSGANFAPIMGFMNGVDPATSEGYMLGLSEADAYQIALKKGSPGGGLDASGSDILRTSTLSWTDVGDGADAWFHLRMDLLVNPHDECVLNVYQSDLDTYAVTAPTWAAITGMGQYIDDSIGILTGSIPHTGRFYPFFGMYTEESGSQALFDHVQVYRQTSP